MTYTLLRGRYVIRYPDVPRQGPEPDGDTVKFRPDTPALVEALPRRSGVPADIGPRGVSVRLEAIDALETHFGEMHQELDGANEARDVLLAELGFTGVRFFPDEPNRVESADQDWLPGRVLSNGVDANGRVIGFVYAGDGGGRDGADVFLDESGVDDSVNALMLTRGVVYPAFYGTLPADLRRHLAAASRAARATGEGLWPRSTGDPDGPASVTGLGDLETSVMWPKMFRRLVSYLATGPADLDGFDAWLRADPVHRDDSVFLLDRGEPGNLHDVVRADSRSVQLTVWPEDFVIEPDPPPSGGRTEPPAAGPGEILIVAASPDPAGVDAGHETVTLLNTTSTELDLTGMRLVDDARGGRVLSGRIPAGGVLQVELGEALRLDNRGDTILLLSDGGAILDRVSYTERQVRRGRTICFGRP